MSESLRQLGQEPERIDWSTLWQSLEAGYGAYFDGSYEPQVAPVPELSPDVRGFITTEIFNLIRNNKGAVKTEADYYTIISKFEPNLFRPDEEDAVIKFWGHRDVPTNKTPDGPLYKVTYHRFYGYYSSGISYNQSPLMTILFRDPAVDVVAFRQREGFATEDFAITDAMALQLNAEIVSTGLLPEDYGLAA